MKKINYHQVEQIKKTALKHFYDLKRSEELLHERNEAIKPSTLDIVILLLLESGVMNDEGLKPRCRCIDNEDGR
jgi:hypothetical protein